MDKDTQLPAAVVEEINTKSERFANKYLNGRVNTRDFAIIEDTYISCATEYAIKLHQATDLIKRMNERCKVLHHDELANDIKTFLDGTK